MLGNCFIEIITKGTREPFDWLKDGLMHYRIGEKSRQRNTLEVRWCLFPFFGALDAHTTTRPTR